jgi:hypothetical protein
MPPLEGTTLSQERRLVGSRDVTFATRGLNPPSMLYVTADDGLYVAVVNIQGGQSITIAAQFLLPDGRLQPNVWTINPPATGALTTYLYNLAEGYLFNLTVQPVPNTRRGVTWIYAALRRGSLASGNNLQTLIQDYIDSLSGPTWPGGQLRSPTDGHGLPAIAYTATVPAGQQYLYTVPSYARIVIRTINAYFQASAQVATRQAYMNMLDNSGHVVYYDTVEATQAASAGVQYTWAYLLGINQTTVVAGSVLRSLPEQYLNPGYSINLGAINNQTGDQWQSINIALEQWFSV